MVIVTTFCDQMKLKSVEKAMRESRTNKMIIVWQPLWTVEPKFIMH